MIRTFTLCFVFLAVSLSRLCSNAQEVQAIPELRNHLFEANRAQLVMFAERDLLPMDQVRRLAQGLHQLAGEQNDPGVTPVNNYRAIEAILVDRIGPEASNMHLGRSNNDLGSTNNRMHLRDMTLRILAQLGKVRASVLELAQDNIDTVMPGFTHGVQAQPTTLAHILLAFDAGLARDSERIRQSYERLNHSTLGSAALTTSGYDFDRELLAKLLGFTAVLENSYDAIMVATADSKVEFAGTLGISALGVGRFIQLIMFQYDESNPGIMVTGDMISTSSIMPQKRNPSAIERLRLRASEVAANANAAMMFVHNTPMYEVKDIREDHLIRSDRFAREALDMYVNLELAIKSLLIRKDVLRDKVDGDYATMTELADTLHRIGGLPYRQGYQVASELTTYGRGANKRPLELTHEEVAAVYKKVTGDDLPLTPEQYLEAVDPAVMIANRKGRGGPQPAEAQRMIQSQGDDQKQTADWVESERDRLESASADLNRRFAKLLN